MTATQLHLGIFALIGALLMLGTAARDTGADTVHMGKAYGISRPA